MTGKIIQLIGIFIVSYLGFVNIGSLVKDENIPVGNLLFVAIAITMIFYRIIFG